jgi:hypothetical protein
MKTMNIPGFTAEASLYKPGAHFQASTATDLHGGLMHPVTLSSTVYTPPKVYCLSKLVCKPKSSWPWLECSYTGFGVWNPATKRCE